MVQFSDFSHSGSSEKILLNAIEKYWNSFPQDGSGDKYLHFTSARPLCLSELGLKISAWVCMCKELSECSKLLEKESLGEKKWLGG